MRILMLGWEFPPFIAGGLGTACYGLTKALDALGHEITFVLPKAVNRSHSSHVRLLSPEEVTALDVARAAPIIRQIRASGDPASVSEIDGEQWRAGAEFRSEEFRHVTFRAVPSGISSPYGAGGGATPEQIESLIRREREVRGLEARAAGAGADAGAAGEGSAALAATPGFLGLSRPSAGGDYGGDLIGDVRRYAELCVMLTRGEKYDVIHAHDWLTYPAGMAIARLTGIPLVVHVHSTEFDRSGEHINRQLYEIERRGMHSAMRVITVSFWTRNIVMHRYNVSPDKIRVVWNGIESHAIGATPTRIRASDKIVLFLGRITMQKGPEYFIAAARRVLEKIEDVKFVVAGSGDMATRMIELAAQMGIGHKVLFTGFLRGADVERAYKMADCYVMPSVSEPFGIAPLEAMSHDVPVIISKQSGVSEALTHVLKVDFWDVDEMANKIIAVLKYPPLRNALRRNGAMELRHLTWDGAARKCVEVYEGAVGAMTRLAM